MLDAVLQVLDSFNGNFHAVAPPPQHAGDYLPAGLGQFLIFILLYGFGPLGLVLALWALKCFRSGMEGLLILLFCTLILPCPYALLVVPSLCLSHADLALPLILAAPFFAWKTSVPACLMYLATWFICSRRKRRNLSSKSAPRP